MLMKFPEHAPFGDLPVEAVEKLASSLPALDALALAAAVELGRASASVVAALSASAGEAGLSPARWRALVTLAALAPPDGLPAGALADRLHIRHATATRLVDSLVSAGLVRRKRDRADRRVVRLAVSTKGQARLREALPHLDARARALVASLGGAPAATELASALAEAVSLPSPESDDAG